MATYCPCGCEKRLGWTDRSIAKKARVIEEKRAFIEQFALPIRRTADANPQELESFIGDGADLRDNLIQVIHSGDGRAVDRANMMMWVKTATRIENQTKVSIHQARSQG